MPVAIRIVNTRRNGRCEPEPQETTMALFGKQENTKPAIVNFGGRWPLAFRVRMLTITGMISPTPIPRRQS